MQLSPSRDFNLKYPKPIYGFLIIRSLLSHRHQTIPKLGVYSCPPLSLFAWQIAAKQYTQFRKTLCRVDRHIILGRIMYDMHYTLMYSAEWMMHYTRTCNTDLEEYIALRCTMWIFKEYYTRTYNMIFDFALHSDIQYDFRFILYSDV